MFENLTQETLQSIWWIIISLLGGLLAFLLFVQGGQSMLFQLGKTEEEKTLVLNSIGRKWDLSFTTLVVFGGAFFASFPLFYATSFGGAYWVWTLLLFSYIVLAVSYEFRSKPNNFLGAKTFEWFLVFNGFVSPFVIGAAVSTFFTGSNFIVNDYNLSHWAHPARGLDVLLDVRNVTLGIAVVFLARILGLLFVQNNLEHAPINARIHKLLQRNLFTFLIFFLSYMGTLIRMDGFAFEPTEQIFYMQSTKYLANFLEMPIVASLFLAGVVLVLTGVFATLIKNSKKGIWFSGSGTILTVFSLFLLAGFNNTPYYPSNADLQSSLSIYNSSSSHYTLTAMSYVALFIPFVAGYIWYAWRALSKNKVTSEDVNSDEHVY